MTLTEASTQTECVVGSTDIPNAYASLYRSNACPSTEVSTDIRSLINQHERRLAIIQSHVSLLKAQLADMERHEIETRGVLAQLAATLAPIKRLQPEILSEIFEYCLDPKNPGVLFSVTARSREAPLLFVRVCRAWRAVAHATPRLWRDVFINVCDGRHSDALRRDALPVLHTWLAYSGSLPLNLVVLSKTERVLPGLVDVFGTIAAHATRWKTVNVRLQNAPVIYRLVCRAFSGCTSLSTLEVTDGGESTSFFAGARRPEEEGDVQPLAFNLSLAPLHELSLSLAGLAIRNVHAPWATLTRLSFMHDTRSSTSTVTDYVAILQQCTSLRECTLAIGNGIRDAPLEPLTLLHLECLSLQVFREASQTTVTTQVGDFLSVLHAPRLRALTIEDHCPRRETVLYHRPLKAFLQVHGQSLRQLRFSTNSKVFEAEDMVRLIVETPGLVELEYRPDEESSPVALLEALTPREEGDVVECLLPCLERFFVYWDTSETVSMVGNMIERRHELVKRGIARLKHLSCKPVRIHDNTPPYMLVESLAARLEQLCRCGLQVDWEGYRYDLEFWYC